MAMAVTYAVQDGMILWETRSGVTTVYVPDHNGNVIECRDNSGNQTYSCEYWPYGEVQTSTGTNPGKFGFGGIVGYVTDLATRLYVRARHYAPARASWLTVDPLWPDEPALKYANCRPTDTFDPSGEQVSILKPTSRDYASSCAGVIWKVWNRTQEHHWNGSYTHCMSCCLLTKISAPDDAMAWQALQMATDKRRGYHETNKNRAIACAAGVLYGLMNIRPPLSPLAACHEHCIARFPHPKDNKKHPKEHLPQDLGMLPDLAQCHSPKCP